LGSRLEPEAWSLPERSGGFTIPFAPVACPA